MTDTLAQPTVPTRPTPLLPRMTFQEFLEWSDEEHRAEWVDGEVVLLSPSNLDHQDLLGFLYEIVRAFLRANPIGRVFFAPVLMHLPTRPSGREPDLLFVAAEHADRLRETYVDGPADLVVEIVSPESDARDRREKLAEYEAARIPEYWMIDPRRQEARFYQLDVDGRYTPRPLDADGFLHSDVLSGFRLRPAWLWLRPLPPVDEVLAEIGI